MRKSYASVVTAAALVSAGSWVGAAQPSLSVTQETHSPDVLLVVLDDVPADMLAGMAAVHRRVVHQGTRFDHAVVPTALCAPSRASLLTGRLAHNTGIYSNRTEQGDGWAGFQSLEADTLATRLHAAGYRTALVGKYMNGFEAAAADYVPAGWDDFQAFGRTTYYSYDLKGTISELYGTAPEDYSTDVLAEHAVDVVTSTPVDVPLFLYFAPKTAHHPFVPAPRHVGTWDAPITLPGGFNEADMRDKPAFMRGLPFVDRVTIRREIRRQHEMLMSADEAVAHLLTALRERGTDTLVILLSDNSQIHGAHRMTGKQLPYVGSSGVPLVIRWPGHVPAGTVSHRVALNVDVTATVAEAAGVADGWVMDGRSLLSQTRWGAPLEQIPVARGDVLFPAYCGWRTRDWLYVAWSGGAGQELYRYSTDPFELQSLARNPDFRSRLRHLRSHAQASCSPTPPGFSWN